MLSRAIHGTRSMPRIACAPLVLLAALAGCSDRDRTPPDPQAAAPTIIDDQLKQIERAKATEQQILDSQKKVDEAMEQQEGG